MIDKFIRKIESLTKEQISACLLVVLLAGFSLGFGFGVGVEHSIEKKCGANRMVDDDWNIVKKVDTNLRRMKKVCRFKIIG